MNYRPKVDPAARNQVVTRFLDELKNSESLESRTRLEYYNYLKWGRLNPESRFNLLVCNKVRQMRECPTTGARSFVRRRVCRLRFYCQFCSEEWGTGQVNKWEKVIRHLLCEHDFFLCTCIRIAWDVPDPEDKTALNRFAKYVEQTWSRELGAQGIEPGQWIMPCAYDATLAQVRGFYLGPEMSLKSPSRADLRSTRALVSLRTSDSSETSALVLVNRGGQFSPWKPRRVANVTLIPALPYSPSDEAEYFRNQIRSGLEWVAGSPLDLAARAPEEAYKLARTWHGKRLYRIHGARSVRQLPSTENPCLMLIRRPVNAPEELVVADPVELYGHLREPEWKIIDEEESTLCRVCGESLSRHKDVFEEIDSSEALGKGGTRRIQ